jgi:hypothetical protein
MLSRAAERVDAPAQATSGPETASGPASWKDERIPLLGALPGMIPGTHPVEDEDRADPEREAHLLAAQAAQPRPGRHCAQERRLAVLMRERPRRQPSSESGGNFVAEDQRRQRLPTRPF